MPGYRTVSPVPSPEFARYVIRKTIVSSAVKVKAASAPLAVPCNIVFTLWISLWVPCKSIYSPILGISYSTCEKKWNDENDKTNERQSICDKFKSSSSSGLLDAKENSINILQSYYKMTILFFFQAIVSGEMKKILERIPESERSKVYFSFLKPHDFKD